MRLPKAKNRQNLEIEGDQSYGLQVGVQDTSVHKILPFQDWLLLHLDFNRIHLDFNIGGLLGHQWDIKRFKALANFEQTWPQISKFKAQWYTFHMHMSVTG